MITHTNIKLTQQLLLWLLLTWQLLFISPPLSCITTHWLSCIRLIPRLGTRVYTSCIHWVSTSWYSSTDNTTMWILRSSIICVASYTMDTSKCHTVNVLLWFVP